MYKVTLELTSGILELYIDNILDLGKVILEHQDEYTGCRIQKINKKEEITNEESKESRSINRR